RSSGSDQSFGGDAFIISRALSNICAPITKRSSFESAMIFSRTVSSISGGVSLIRGIRAIRYPAQVHASNGASTRHRIQLREDFAHRPVGFRNVSPLPKKVLR